MKQDITLVRNRTYNLSLSVVDSSGEPLELSPGEAICFGIKRSAIDSNYIVSKIIDSYASQGVPGIFNISLSCSDTANLTGNEYFYDIALKGVSGQETTMYSIIDISKIRVVPNITTSSMSS